MSHTAKCPKNHGDTSSLTDGCCCGGDNGVHLPACPVPTSPVPTPALDRLDFEATFNALMVANGYDKQNAEWLTSAVLPYLNAQVAEIVRVARREERALCVAELRSLKGRKIRIQSWYDGVEESAYQLTLKLPENHPIPEAR